MSRDHAMDVPIERPRRLIHWRAVAVVVVVAVAVILIQMVRSASASLAVDRAGLVIATVERGALVREAHGTGTLVAEHSRIVAAETSGRVESIRLRAGERVEPSTVVLVLANPEVSRGATDARAALAMAEAELTGLQAQLNQHLMMLRAELAQIEGDAEEARARAQSLAELAKAGLASASDVYLANVRDASLAKRAALAAERLRLAEAGLDSQLAAKRAAVAQAVARHQLQNGLLEALQTRASLTGIVQEVLVESGQHVTPGQNLARIADPTAMIARVHIAPAQARDVVPGLDARVDTHSGVVSGRVARVDPAVREGSVAVDVSLAEPLPAGVRPDSTIEATIVLGTIADTVIVRRPANADEHSTVELFRLEGDEREARRTRVALGRASATSIEIRNGLRPGDRVVISDTTAWQEYNRIRIR